MGWVGLESTKRRYRKGNRGIRAKRATTKDRRKGLLWGVQGSRKVMENPVAIK